MNDKELVAHAALEYVKDNSIIGLGTGSTANIFIEMLAEKIRSRSLNISVVAVLFQVNRKHMMQV